MMRPCDHCPAPLDGIDPGHRSDAVEWRAELDRARRGGLEAPTR